MGCTCKDSAMLEVEQWVVPIEAPEQVDQGYSWSHMGLSTEE